jgi:uncharacterized protein (DUF2342 family)
MAITEALPMMIPSMVRLLRRRLAARVLAAMEKLSGQFIGLERKKEGRGKKEEGLRAH